MEIKIIFYSYTGITRGGVAQKIQRACGGGDLVEVKTVKPYSALTAYSMGCYRAMRGGESDPIEPSVIDVSTSDLIVIGTPVWAFRAPPAINAAVEALSGCEGKSVILFATCGGGQAKIPSRSLPKHSLQRVCGSEESLCSTKTRWRTPPRRLMSSSLR